MRLLLTFIAITLLASCNKPNPNPELLDPVYAEIKKSLDQAKSDHASTKTTHEEHQDTLSKVVPQTGQIKYAQKRLNEAANRLNHTEQMVKYWEIKLESRLAHDRESYILAWSKKEPWPDPKEIQEYRAFLASESKSRQWSYQNRMAELGLPVKTKGAVEPDKAADKKAEATKVSK